MLYGLIGFPLEHSTSMDYFNAKFQSESIDAHYMAMPIQSLHNLDVILKEYPDLAGFNVTSPYKEKILPLLSRLDAEAAYIGAVNVVKIVKGLFGKKEMVGYNTDVIAFEETLKAFDISAIQNALILGTGGAAKAVARAFKHMNIACDMVSRYSPENTQIIHYSDLTEQSIQHYSIIVNATPLGMFPHTQKFPPIPYSALSSLHICYDLIYNPNKTEFLKKAEKQDATIKNGMEMLLIQAEETWKIWNK
ncbi:shikimate dehydrogenase [Bacteroides heparinolyticus]|uniref:shikimate dehydrogenase family protein n=1 Tax=Prevotella heparinolytica TaxID=28113 RepID=UPI0035A1D38B